MLIVLACSPVCTFCDNSEKLLNNKQKPFILLAPAFTPVENHSSGSRRTTGLVLGNVYHKCYY